MKSKTFIILVLVTIFMSFKNNNEDKSNSQAGGFNIKEDLLLVQFDCKTDVDDLHTVAAFATLLSDSVFSTIKYHAVAGTYGIQGGLYVPPNDLFQLAFGDNWTDAHNNVILAVEKVKEIVKMTLKNQGNIWIAEAGQSDFSAELIKAIQKDIPEINTTQCVYFGLIGFFVKFGADYPELESTTFRLSSSTPALPYISLFLFFNLFT